MGATKTKVIGRIHWDKTHTSPWMSFPNVTAFRKWTTAVRKARPGIRTEFSYLDLVWEADFMLRSLQAEAEDVN